MNRRRAAWALPFLLAACSGGGAAQEPSTSGTGTSGPGSTPVAAEGDACWTSPAPAVVAPITWRDATGAFGLVEPLLGMRAHASAWGDVDGDGWLDLFVGTFADRDRAEYRERGATAPAPDRLLLGGPDGFTPADDFPELRGRTSGAVFADLDGDDDLDLLVTRNTRRRGEEAAVAPSVILRNDGGALSVAAELLDGRGARGVGVLDVDGDGLLDLFVTVDPYRGGSSVLLRNEGDLRFTEATADAGIPADVAGFAVAAADLSGDGRTDLFVAGSNRLFVADGDGTFTERDSSVFAFEPRSEEDIVAGVATGDVDGDGRTDLVLGPHFNSTLDDGNAQPVRLFLNRGDLRFEDVTEEAGLVALPTKAPHVEVADLDNDGRPDIVTSASAAGGNEPAVFRNRGVEDGTPRFEAPDGLGDAQYWVTGGAVDVDRDGALDLFLTEFEPDLPSRLWRGGPGGHWLEVAVDGPGTVVEAFAAGRAGDPSARLARREYVAVEGYGAGAAPVVHVGLGDVTEVDVRVTAADGTVRQATGVPADRQIRVPGGCG